MDREPLSDLVIKRLPGISAVFNRPITQSLNHSITQRLTPSKNRAMMESSPPEHEHLSDRKNSYR